MIVNLPGRMLLYQGVIWLIYNIYWNIILIELIIFLGSSKAVKECFSFIQPVLGHAVDLLKGKFFKYFFPFLVANFSKLLECGFPL